MSDEEYYDDVNDTDINQLINEVEKTQGENIKLNNAINMMATEKKDGNFLHYQLATDEMLEKLEHFYRSDYQGYDEAGDFVWMKQTDTDLITFNDFGVSSIMELVSKYIDRNTILSNYPEERIYEILGDIGDDLILFVLCNYEKMGMDTHFKKTKFRLIITTTTHIIESAYRRAKNGKTLIEINQSRVVGQFGSINNDLQQKGRPKKEGFFNKMFH